MNWMNRLFTLTSMFVACMLGSVSGWAIEVHQYRLAVGIGCSAIAFAVSAGIGLSK